MEEILLVDDDRVVRAGLRHILSGEGYAVREARNGEAALAALDERLPDLVVLDVMMPGKNGFLVCEEIRRRDAGLPVIFLSARDTEVDQVRGFGTGGDDYLPKTTPPAVFLARVRRALDRGRLQRRNETPSTPLLTLGPVTVDFVRLEVREGPVVIERLTATERGILRLLHARNGRLCTTDEIVRCLRGEGYACEDNMVYTHVSRLRRKLGEAGRHIVCSRGCGYSLKP